MKNELREEVEVEISIQFECEICGKTLKGRLATDRRKDCHYGDIIPNTIAIELCPNCIEGDGQHA